MHNSLGKIWVALAFQQLCNYRLVNVVVSKGVEASCSPGRLSLIDSYQDQTSEPLNPLEFHGKRRPGWPPRAHVGKSMA